jgi:hypothetical protein
VAGIQPQNQLLAVVRTVNFSNVNRGAAAIVLKVTFAICRERGRGTGLKQESD